MPGVNCAHRTIYRPKLSRLVNGENFHSEACRRGGRNFSQVSQRATVKSWGRKFGKNLEKFRKEALIAMRTQTKQQQQQNAARFREKS